MKRKVKIINKIYQTIPDAVLVTSFPNGKIEFFNSAFCHLTGYSPSYLRENNIDDICFFRVRGKRREIENILYKKGKVINIGFEILNKDKKNIYCICSSKIAIIDGEKYVVSIIKNVTKQKQREERMIYLSITDSLTGLYNRMKIDEILRNEINNDLSIIILDIDHFKKINDKYGHHMGDLVLEEFARILKSNVYEGGRIGRWGGEEFLIVLPGKDVEEAKSQAEKLRNAISSQEFLGLGYLTASFGVASTDYIMNEIELVSKADEALYSAKRKGRNKVVVA